MDPWLLIVICGAAIIGFAYLKSPASAEDKKSVVNDIESALDQFAEELEEDNRQLMNTVAGLKRELEAEINKLNGRIEALEKHAGPIVLNASAALDTQDEAEKPKAKRTDRKAAPAEEKPSRPVQEQTEEEAETKAEPNIKNRYTPIFELHAQGKSIEYIAKKTGMNKGEVQLIIQLARQEEQFRD